MGVLKYYKSIDGLRAIAVLIVLFAHAKFPRLQSGGVGVDVFFLLSGFLITSILNSELEFSKNINIKYFYVRRGLRLIPCLIATSLFFIVIEFLLLQKFSFGTLVYILTYSSNWARALYDYDLGSMSHTWSLSIEEQFYLVWPCVIILVSKYIKQIELKFLFFIALTILITSYRYFVSGIYSPERIYFGTDTHIDGLLLGSSLVYFLGLILDSKNLSKIKYVINILVPGCFIIILIFPFIFTWRDLWMQRFGYSVIFLSSSVILMHLVLSEGSFVSRVLSFRLISGIGKISYGLYLWHFPLYFLIDFINISTSLYMLILIKLVLAIVIASLSYHLLERNFLKLKSNYAIGKLNT